jgi:stearoyl-CoA desaturase (delta-9 desaturase)
MSDVHPEAPNPPVAGADVPRKRRWLPFNIAIIVGLPLFAVPASAVYLWRHGITGWEIATAVVLWVITGMGITAGYHRLFAHRSYSAAWPVRAAFAVAGAMAGQNSIIAWCSDHRRHHRVTDTDSDPYDATKGLWWSHMGWILQQGSSTPGYSDVPDLWADPIARFQHRHWIALSVLGNLALVLPVGLVSDRVGGVLLLAGLLRFIAVQHFTFTINSLSHWWGRQPFSSKNSSRDNRFLALFTFGEGYHNYHHTFQADYRNGIAWYDWDPSKWLIRALAAVRLAGDLRRTPEHTVLKARYERAREEFDARMAQARAEATARVDALRVEFQRAREAADARFQDRLQELRTRTQAWAEARREAAEAASAEREALLREMERSIRDAAREAQRSLEEWQRAARREMALAA